MNMHYLAAIVGKVRLDGGSLVFLSVIALNATGRAGAPLVASSSEITVRVKILETKSRGGLDGRIALLRHLRPRGPCIDQQSSGREVPPERLV